MNREQLVKLFRKYLNRYPTEEEVNVHGHKEHKTFEDEISKCPERKMIQNGNKLPTNRRVAILVTGHMRKLKILESLERAMRRAKGIEFDVFCFTWDNIGLKGKETNINDEVDLEEVRSMVLRLPNLVSYEIQNNREFILKNQNREATYFNFSSPEVFLKSQLYSIEQSFRLMEEFSNKNNIKYDLVMRVRADLEIREFSVDEKTFQDINNHKIIFVPNTDSNHPHSDSITGTSCMACDRMYHIFDMKEVHVFEHTNIICDIFAYGSFSSMKKYCSLYHHFEKINRSFVKENLINLEKYNVEYVKEGNVYKIENHNDTTYYINCSYPERLIQKYMSDYMLVESKKIRVRFHK